MLKMTRRDKIDAINNIDDYVEKFKDDSAGACFIEVLIETVKINYRIPNEINLTFREALLIMLAREEQ